MNCCKVKCVCGCKKQERFCKKEFTKQQKKNEQFMDITKNNNFVFLKHCDARLTNMVRFFSLFLSLAHESLVLPLFKFVRSPTLVNNFLFAKKKVKVYIAKPKTACDVMCLSFPPLLAFHAVLAMSFCGDCPPPSFSVFRRLLLQLYKPTVCIAAAKSFFFFVVFRLRCATDVNHADSFILKIELTAPPKTPVATIRPNRETEELITVTIS
jgi:hypothetical protein